MSRAEVWLAEQPRQRREGNLRALRLPGNRVQCAADKRPSGDSQGKCPQSTARSHQGRGAQPAVRGGQRVAGARGSADHEPFDSTARLDRQSDERRQAPSAEPFDRGPDDCAAECGADDDGGRAF